MPCFSRRYLLLALSHVFFVESKQPSAPEPIPATLRELPWGQLNFLHTTDTHGWFAGHLSEPQYSADWGDYISFAQHLRKRADDDGSDLLLIDTGDRVEGNGLYDASDPKGKYTLDIIKQQQIDVITTGNHELYKRNTSIREYERTVRDFKDSYIASNLDIYDTSSENITAVPFARRFRKFTTKNQGVRILAFGFIFDFRGNDNNTVVQLVEQTVKEEWFKDAIKDTEVDLILVAGHVTMRDSPEYDLIYKTIRAAQWDTPIVFFGGHSHIRDFRKWEKKAQGIQSGRYMETIGFLSVSGVSSGGKKSDTALAAASINYNRRYIDNNLFSLYHHSATNQSTFPTDLGKNVSTAIRESRKELRLDHVFGCAPKDYWLYRAEYPSNDSMLTLLEKRVLPDAFRESQTTPTMIITNSGALRFDIFKGPFTTDTTFLVSPFDSGFNVIKGVPYEAAAQVLKILNNAGQILLTDLLALAGEPSWGRWKLETLVPHSPVISSRLMQRDLSDIKTADIVNNQIPLLPATFKDGNDDAPSLPGYTTTDDAGSDGDDTVHAPIRFFPIPNCIGSYVGFDPENKDNDTPDPETVDLIYNSFIQDWVLLALRYSGVRYGAENASPALGGKTMTDVISDWVAENWKCDE